MTETKTYTGALFVCTDPKFPLDKYTLTNECYRCNGYYKKSYEYCPRCGDSLDPIRDKTVQLPIDATLGWNIPSMDGIYLYEPANLDNGFRFIFYPREFEGLGTVPKVGEPKVFNKLLTSKFSAMFDSQHKQLTQLFSTVDAKFGSIVIED